MPPSPERIRENEPTRPPRQRVEQIKSWLRQLADEFEEFMLKENDSSILDILDWTGSLTGKREERDDMYTTFGPFQPLTPIGRLEGRRYAAEVVRGMDRFNRRQEAVSALKNYGPGNVTHLEALALANLNCQTLSRLTRTTDYRNRNIAGWFNSQPGIQVCTPGPSEFDYGGRNAHLAYLIGKRLERRSYKPGDIVEIGRAFTKTYNYDFFTGDGSFNGVVEAKGEKTPVFIVTSTGCALGYWVEITGRNTLHNVNIQSSYYSVVTPEFARQREQGEADGYGAKYRPREIKSGELSQNIWGQSRNICLIEQGRPQVSPRTQRALTHQD